MTKARVTNATAANGRRRGLWLVFGYSVCLAVSIPWYRNPGTLDPRFGGFPLWALVALAGSLAMAALTWYALSQPWPGETEQPETEPPETAQPETAQPETAQPETAQPETAQPDGEPHG